MSSFFDRRNEDYQEQELSYEYILKNSFFQDNQLQAWILSDDSTYREANNVHGEFIGKSLEDIRGTDCREFFPAEEAQNMILDNQFAFEKNRRLVTEQTLTNGQGQARILEIIRTPIQISPDSDEVEAVACLASDVTEQRIAEKELFEKEEIFQSIISTLPDLLVVLDAEGRYKRIWTGQAGNLYAPRNQLLGRKIAEVLPQDVADKIMTHLKRALASLEIEVFEYELEVIGGQKHFEGRMTAASSNRVVMVIRDMTERYQGRQKIEGLHEVAKELAVVNREEDIYQLTVEAAEKILEFDVCSLDIVEGDLLEVKATSSGVPEDGSLTMPVDEGVAGMVYQTGESRLTADIREEPEANPVKSEYKSAISVPIGDYGVFQVISTEYNKFTQSDLHLAELLISHTATAIERVRAEEEIRYLGFHDKLTGLYNRQYIEEELERLDTKRQLPISIIVGDVNSLKLVNDAFGHEQGDRMLKLIADVLEKSCRQEDIIGRTGGDEFMIILPQTSRREAKKIINRIQENSAEISDCIIPLSIALGLSCKEKEAQDIREVLKNADASMYENKFQESDKTRNIIIDTLLDKLGEKKYESREHCRRLKEMAISFGQELELPEREINKLAEAAFLHDIGLISIPENEFTLAHELKNEKKIGNREMEKHPEIGYRIARSSDKLTHLAKAILYHHERWDGSGYPRGLSGKNIPLTSRIIAIIDAYDSMVNKKKPGPLMEKTAALATLKQQAGSKFDPELVNLFCQQVID